ncbi:class I SAM-dependent methyltransferase [Deinococcus sp. Arct2-2]|uniref:class I SAM-dependent methyltransferase n=1 Tax=Deinococcus sp. Arct2-2 TaxID=2568653 RepID=UPI0010A31D68|nr:class I SAM-dependent methyltransferase [Deinococcus sp. Arct2-2]THF71038.1 class I SAM-dependent methyltransferase [Deinococcus sp. Arct2-2]
MHNVNFSDAEFNDLRLARLYETLCPWGRSDQFFLDLVNEIPNSRVLDLGCGTGQITLALAKAGHTVTGIDPAAASLTLARAKPGAERVIWIEGTSADAPANAFDLALMTNHVAQFIADDGAWLELLEDVHRALAPGGRLVFDSRDPVAREWEKWTRLGTYQQTPLPEGKELETWTELEESSGDLVTFVHHYAFSDTKEVLLSRSTLRFRPEETLRASLKAVGFEIEGIYGGWHYEPVGQGDGEFILVARAKK